MFNKEFKLQISYIFNLFKKNGIRCISYFLIISSIVLSLGIILPNLFTHRLFMFGIENPRILQIEGLVILKNKDGQNSPLAGSTIEIGGYKTYADQDGKYQLKFLSKKYYDIPVIIQSPNRTEIKRISFQGDEYKKTEEFFLDEK